MCQRQNLVLYVQFQRQLKISTGHLTDERRIHDVDKTMLSLPSPAATNDSTDKLSQNWLNLKFRKKSNSFCDIILMARIR